MNEDQHTEWKTSWRDEHLKWVCGFANAEGGLLVIGRDDRGEVVGIANAHRLLEELPNKVRDLLGILVEVNLRTEAGLEFLELRVEAYPSPVSYRGDYYVRSGSTNQKLQGAALDRFLLRKYGRTWDSAPLPGLSLDDLDAEALVRFRKQAAKSKRLSVDVLDEDDAGLIDKLRLIEGDYLKRAAALLFHPDPERFFTGAAIKIGYFATESDLRYHDEVQGNLFTQVEKTMDLLLTKYLKATISYEGIQRIESYPMPVSALREALLNAVIHRDYAVPAPIQIRVHGNRLLIWNPGELPDNWSSARLMGDHPSDPYNPDIANTFFRAGEIEAWGRGIQRVLDACREADTPEPKIRAEARDLCFEFPFSDAYLASVLTEAPGGTAQKTGEKTTPITTPITTPKTVERILTVLRANPTASRSEIAAVLGDITGEGVRYHLRKLNADGRIRHIGPSRGGRWEVLADE